MTPVIFSFQVVFILIASLSWVKVVRNVQTVLTLHTTRNLENQYQIASRVLKVSSNCQFHSFKLSSPRQTLKVTNCSLSEILKLSQASKGGQVQIGDECT